MVVCLQLRLYVCECDGMKNEASLFLLWGLAVQTGLTVAALLFAVLFWEMFEGVRALRKAMQRAVLRDTAAAVEQGAEGQEETGEGKEEAPSADQSVPPEGENVVTGGQGEGEEKNSAACGEGGASVVEEAQPETVAPQDEHEEVQHSTVSYEELVCCMWPRWTLRSTNLGQLWCGEIAAFFLILTALISYDVNRSAHSFVGSWGWKHGGGLVVVVCIIVRDTCPLFCDSHAFVHPFR